MTNAPDPKTTSALLGLMVHDLRNPLSALQSNVGYLRAHPDVVGEMLEALVDVEASCVALSHIIDNLELLAQNLRSETREDRVEFHLEPLVEEVLTKVRPVMESYGARVQFARTDNALTAVIASREMVLRAVTNLLQNAIQHSPSTQPIVLTVTAENGNAVVRVLDSGAALDVASRAEVFTAEGQLASKSIATSRYSRGFGLLSAQFAALATGARVYVGEPGTGFSNVFCLEVPLKRHESRKSAR